MAISEVSIANRALQKLGVQKISSLTQDSPNARSVSTAYEPVRDSLMRKYRWNFCIKRASVAADSAQDTYEGLNRYRLPNDFARLLRDQKSSVFVESYKDWQIENGFILTSTGAPLQFRYLARVTDPALFDAEFAELLSAKIALEIVHDVTGSNAKKQDLRVDYREALADARAANSFENPPAQAPEDEWLAIMR